MSETNSSTPQRPDGDRMRFKARDDLTVVHAQGDGATDGSVSLVDRDSGKRFVFTEAEYRMFAVADGQNDFDQMAEAIAAAHGDAPGTEELQAFFRRAHILGLVSRVEVPVAEDKPTATGPSRLQTLEKLAADRARPAGRRTAPTTPKPPSRPKAAAAVSKGAGGDAADKQAMPEAASPGAKTAARGTPGEGAKPDKAATPKAGKPQGAEKKSKKPEPESKPKTVKAEKTPANRPQKAAPAKADAAEKQPAKSEKAKAETARDVLPGDRMERLAKVAREREEAEKEARRKRAKERQERAKPLREAVRRQVEEARETSQDNTATENQAAETAPPAPQAKAGPDTAGADNPETTAQPKKNEEAPPNRRDELAATIEKARTTPREAPRPAAPPAPAAGPDPAPVPADAPAPQGSMFGGGAGFGLGNDLPEGDGPGQTAPGGGGQRGERLRAALAARRDGAAGAPGGGGDGAFGGGLGLGMGGGLGAGMRGRGAAGFGGMGGFAPSPDGQGEKTASIYLFDPGWLLRAVYVLFYPLSLLTWLLLPMVVIAGLTMFHRWQDLSQDLFAMLDSYWIVTRLLLGLFTVNLASRLAQGAAIVAAGGKVREFGLRLVFLVVPRFYVDVSGIQELDRKGQLSAFGAPLMMRLGLFAGGVLGWAIYRDTGTWLPQLFMIVGQFGLIMFVISSFPLIPADGLRWLATYYGEPKLPQKAAIVLKYRLSGRPVPPIVAPEDVRGLVFFGSAVLITMAAIVLGLGFYAAIMLEQALGGTGVVIFLGLAVAATMWLVTIMTFGGGKPRGDGAAGLAGGLGDGMIGYQAAPGTLLSKAKVLWAVVGVGLLAVAFLPYQYEAGGVVEILPSERGHAAAHTEADISEILVVEGDTVEAGQIVARQASWRQTLAIDVTRTELESARARLAQIKAGAKPEEIELARRRVASAETALKFDQVEADRAQTLLDTGTITRTEWERRQSDLEASMADLQVAEAQLDLVVSGATDEEIRVAQADVERLELQLAFQEEELERTRIRAPLSGVVVTPNLHLMQGQYLDEGETLLEIERTDTVLAEIAIPEADIGLVEIGDPVRLKTYGKSEEEVGGSVFSIAPVAEQRDFGRVVRLVAVFDNAEGLLRSDMTGFAKVEGDEMPVWRAFLRRAVRFFEVDVWSWIP